MAIDIQFTDAPLGHEVRGVDLNALDDATFGEIADTFDKYGVIVIRGQSLLPRQQVDFSRRFGSLDRFVLDRFNMKELPEVFVLSNIIEDGKPVGMSDAGRYWHSDMWVSDKPPRGSILYSVEVPHRGDEPLGDTYFASTAYAYDTLPQATKDRIENLSAVFSSRLYAEYVGHNTVKDVHTKEIVEARKNIQDREITHRLVRRHPITGRKCLYVVEGVISHIVGMSRAESKALLDELLAHIVRPEAVYRHRWKVGDVVMWDNYAAVHRATGDFELPQRRLMHRTTLSAPGAAANAASPATAGAM
ncbi:TauD/TfdA dioxygenase family protein [Ramlibacter sp.]|uniref:TauD/TfdA dioxygenase family protein n=1 Tax=Ramlibacter sp. TaxID=1917967 RepID=UPI003D0C9847